MKKLILLMMIVVCVCLISPPAKMIQADKETSNEVAVVESAQLTVTGTLASQEVISASDVMLGSNQAEAANSEWTVVRTEAKNVTINSSDALEIANNGAQAYAITAPEVVRDKTVMSASSGFLA